MIKFKYIRKENRDTNFYDIGTKWCVNITKQRISTIIWNKWFLNNRFILYVLKNNIS